MQNKAAVKNKQEKNIKEVFTRSGVDQISIHTEEDYVKQLMLLFKKR